MLGPSQHSSWSQYPEVPIVLETSNLSSNDRYSGDSQQASQLYPAFSRRQSVRYNTVLSPIQTRSRCLQKPVSGTRGHQPRRPVLQRSVSVDSRRGRKRRIHDPTIEQNADGTWTTKYNEKRSPPWSTRSYRGELTASQKTQRNDLETGCGPGLGLGIPHIPDTSTTTGTNSFLPKSQYKPGDDNPPNLVQRIEDRLWRCNSSRNVAERWSLEIISWFISAICMATVVIMLFFMNHKRLPTWPYTLALTVLFKIASAALLLPTSEALGQLKWSWFKGDSRMWDLEIFDLASRGPWGSILLLFRTKCVKLAALGAAITLMALALDPVFQQVTDFPNRWILQGNSSIPKVINYNPQVYTQLTGGKKTIPVNAEIVVAATPFFYGNGTQSVPFGSGIRAEVPLSCPTGNCTWLPYQTLGFCSACIDVSETLNFACLTTRIDWTNNLTGPGTESTYPNGTVCGYFLNATSTAPVLMSGYIVATNGSLGETLLMRAFPLIAYPRRTPFWGDGSINFKNVRHRMADVIVVSAMNGSASVYRNETPVAHECMVAMCVKTIVSSFYQAKYEEMVVDVFLNTTAESYPWRSTKTGNTTNIQFVENIAITPPVVGRDNVAYGLDNDTAMSTLTVFDEIFPSFLTVEPPSDEPFLRFKTRQKGEPSIRTVEFLPWVAPNNITQHFERMAIAMTNSMRSSSSSIGHIGMAFGQESLVDVHWAWLGLPFGLLALSGVFLVTTMIKTSTELGEVGIWKSSATANLLYETDEAGRPVTSFITSSASSSKGF